MVAQLLSFTISIMLTILLVLKFFMLQGVVSTASFSIVNNCSQTIWPAISSSTRNASLLPISGFALQQGQYFNIEFPASWNGRIWGRTLCTTQSPTWNFTCVTGDCGSGKLECPSGIVDPPATTRFEFAIGTAGGMPDVYDVTLVDGFNLPMLVTPFGGGSNCSSTGCMSDINQVCPSELQVNGTDGKVVACMGACGAFNQDQYCCRGTSSCKPTSYSRFFKSACPTAYSYPLDAATSTFTCAGTDYVLTFCPSLNSSFVRSNGSIIVGPSSSNCTSYNCGGITPVSSGIVNSSYPHCPSYNCGGVTVGYPFWRQDNSSLTQYCGYPGLGVNCSTTGGPILRLPNDTFHIKNISYDNYTLTLFDIDFVNQRCPRARQNLTLGTLPLYYVPLDLNLSFHFNCNSSLSFATPIACLGSSGNQSYVSLVGTEPDDFNWFDYCEENVVVSVMDSAVDINNLSGTFGRAVNQGFMLNWRAPSQCRKCETFGGRCGYNRQTAKFLCFCNDGTTTSHCTGSNAKSLLLKIGIGAGSALIGFLLICFIFYYKTRKSSSWDLVAFWRRNTLHDKKVEAFILQYGASTPKRYRYSDIKRMTNSFKDELGQGGYGSVFKGKLADDRLVAVKVLNASKGNGEEFMNEVASIGRTSHVNIVTLLGFCYEGRKRALIYEFMPNGSLDKFIYGNKHEEPSQHLRVEKLYEIALGIARGLEYLHNGCNTRILHLDIKPQNILLDEDFCPKIADFGLAKLYTKKKSHVSMLEARGTIGYIAPEVFNRNLGGVSHKSDVYSYGMMVIEIVGGRNNSNADAGCSSEIYFPNWIYKRLEIDEDLQLQQGLMTMVENEIARKMILVGLWCIQTDPSQRPSMNKVIEMLEGSLEALEVPPRSFFSSPAVRSTTNTCTASL